ncbi:site-specific integrase [Balneolales bacterium ANBcel1]|nr:site-specific integrase [Balneolales bacterium ANBcel1]
MVTRFHFYLRTDRKKKNGECNIYLRVTHNRKHAYISTGISVLPKYWNDRSESIRKSHSNNKALNGLLTSKREEVENIYEDLEKSGTTSLKAFKNRLTGVYKTNFFDLADDIVSELKSAGKFYPSKNANVTINKLEEFEGNRFLPVKQMDADYLERFEKYLILEHKNGSNTISKNFELIRKVIKQALKDKIITVDPFTTFDGAKRKASGQKLKLSMEQIQKIAKLGLSEGTALWHARNAFLFSFYSGGIRFGDICCLKWKNVREGRLSYAMNKNGKYFSTVMNDYQKEILLRYSSKEEYPEHYIFPFLNSHKKYEDDMALRRQISSKNYIVNKNLAKIAKQAELDDTFSFHVSRHSFAQHAVETGLDVYELMQTLRHTKIETTQKYLKSLDEGLADKAMSKVFGS